MQTVDVTTLLADFGFAPRTAFVSELADACDLKCCRYTRKNTRRPSCSCCASPPFDAQWMGALAEPQVHQLLASADLGLANDTLRWQRA
jgi:hypothetical protein